MRILITGSSGFVGRWLAADVDAAGHELLASRARRAMDVTDARGVSELVARTRPEAIAHLAAISSSIRAAEDPLRAVEVNVGGTINVLEAAAALVPPPVVLVAGSAEVYGWPAAERLPIRETERLEPRGPYAVTKAAQEALGVAYALRGGLRVCVTRSFHHSGPGQRPPFALPSFAERIAEAGRTGRTSIDVGDIDVARDFLDVRDVADAYRRLLEHLPSQPEGSAIVLNVASGKAVPIRALLDRMADRAGLRLEYRRRASLARPGQPAEIRGDASLLRATIDWSPTREPCQMVDDLWDAAGDRGAVG